jgi:hypothetical protein
MKSEERRKHKGVISPAGGGRGWIDGTVNNESSEKLKVKSGNQFEN